MTAVALNNLAFLGALRGQVRERVVTTPWSRDGLSGRMVELSGWGASAALTVAFGLVRETQQQGEPVAWISTHQSHFHPPDVAAGGVDLQGLAVVLVPTPHDAARAADRLVRSGAFGLVVLDLGERAEIPTPLQARLVGLAQRHDTALVCLTVKPPEQGSLGSLSSLRAHAAFTHEGSGRFACQVQALKDKQREPGWTCMEVCHGPPGLR